MQSNKNAVGVTFGAGLVVALVSMGCDEALESEDTGSTGEEQVEPRELCETCPPPTGGGTGGGARIQFWEGNDATQDDLGSIGVTTASHFYDLTSGGNPIANDEARSLTLRNIKAGTTIILCDDPHAWFPLPGFHCGYDSEIGNRDDVTTIDVKQNVSMLTIGTFEQTVNNNYVNVTWKQAGPNCIVGLDGKVSMIKIYPPGTEPNWDCSE
jgi:hypothetical protein